MRLVENQTGPSAGETVLNGTIDVDVVQDYALISYLTRQILTEVNYHCITAPLTACGMVANILNLIVFSKQGFKDSMNISLLGLAIADFFSLATALWISICFSPFFRNPNLPFSSLDLMYVSGGYPHVYFNRITSCITAFITLERCLCISMPLKVKTLITSARTKIILVSICAFLIAVFAPFYFVNKLEWNFNDLHNKTLLILVHEDNRVAVEAVIFLIQGVVLSAICLCLVIICTAILIVKLTVNSKWRQTVTSGNNGSSLQNSVSLKEKKVVKMVTSISAIFIICYTPNMLIIFMIVYEPEFSFAGKYDNLFAVAWSFAIVLEAINSSVNIFVYYNMSSKYKITFNKIIFCNIVERKAPNDVGAEPPERQVHNLRG